MEEQPLSDDSFSIAKTFPKWGPIIITLLLAGITYGVQRTALSLYAKNISNIDLFKTKDHLQDFLIFLQIAATFMSYGLFKGISGFLSGNISEKIKRKNTVRIGLGLLVGGSLMLAFAKYLWALIIGNLFIGGGLGLIFTASMSALTDISGTGGSAFSVGSMEFSVYFGSSIGSFVAGFVAKKSGFAASFIFALIIAVVALLIGIALIRKIETEMLVKGTKEEILFDSTKVETTWSYKDMIKTPTLTLSYLGGHFSRITDSIIILILPIYLDLVVNFDPAQVGAVSSAFTLAWSLSMPITGHLSDRFGRKLQIISGLLIEGLSLVLLIWSKTFTTIFFSALLAGLGTAIYYPVLPSITRDVVPIVKREKALGMYRASLDSGYLTGPLIAIGLVFSGMKINFLAYDELSNMLKFPFFIIGVSLVMLALLFSLLAMETRPGWVQASYSIKHAYKVREVYHVIRKAFEAFLDGADLQEVRRIRQKAKELEHEADNLAFKVTEALYGNIRPAPDDYQFYKITEILDRTIGHNLRSLRRAMLLPREKLSPKFKDYLRREINLLCQLIEKAIEALEVVCIQPRASHPIFKEVHQLENALDTNNHRALELAASETSELNVVQAIYMVEIIESLEIAANEIEDAVDVMKILGIKYQIKPLLHQ